MPGPLLVQVALHSPSHPSPYNHFTVTVGATETLVSRAEEALEIMVNTRVPHMALEAGPGQRMSVQGSPSPAGMFYITGFPVRFILNKHL